MGQQGVMATKNRVLGLVALVSLVAFAPSAGAFAPCHEREIHSETIALLREPAESQFYYRIELRKDLFGGPQYVIYIPPDVAISFIQRIGGFRSSAQGLEPEHWSQLLPLTKHTDIFQPMIRVGGRPHQRMLRLIAESINSGQAAIWNVVDGYMETVIVDHYNDGCESGRIFKDSRGTEFFQIIQTIA